MVNSFIIINGVWYFMLVELVEVLFGLGKNGWVVYKLNVRLIIVKELSFKNNMFI